MIGGPSIVKRGLIWAIDPANPMSYESGSSFIYNIVQDTGHGFVTSSMRWDPLACGCFLGNGTSSIIDFGTQSIFSFNNAILSYGIWFYFDGNIQSRTVISHRNDSPYNQWAMGIAFDAQWGPDGRKFGAFACPDAGGSSNYSNLNTSDDITPGWHYGTATISSTGHKLYMDGVLVDSTVESYANDTFIIPNRTVYVAGNNINNKPANHWNSYISCAHLYNVTLTNREVYQNFNALKGRFRVV